MSEISILQTAVFGYNLTQKRNLITWCSQPLQHFVCWYVKCLEKVPFVNTIQSSIMSTTYLQILQGKWAGRCSCGWRSHCWWLWLYSKGKALQGGALLLEAYVWSTYKSGETHPTPGRWNLKNLKILRNAGLSQESCANAHKALEEGCWLRKTFC